jgi:hemoglobin
MALWRTAVSVLAAASLAACGGKPRGSDPVGAPATPPASLYDRLGGKDAITAIVKDLVEERVAKDPRIKGVFANADVPGLEAKLADQICEIADGPCKYTGKDMKTAHAGMIIRGVDFDALVEDLEASLAHFQVAGPAQADLIAALAKLRGAIVTAK